MRILITGGAGFIGSIFALHQRAAFPVGGGLLPLPSSCWRSGEAKLKIKEMGSRYFFIVAYVWLEKYFSRGDYRNTARTAS
jgi:hypothetical protein